jgi:hypothetical protein
VSYRLFDLLKASTYVFVDGDQYSTVRGEDARGNVTYMGLAPGSSYFQEDCEYELHDQDVELQLDGCVYVKVMDDAGEIDGLCIQLCMLRPLVAADLGVEP